MHFQYFIARRASIFFTPRRFQFLFVALGLFLIAPRINAQTPAPAASAFALPPRLTLLIGGLCFVVFLAEGYDAERLRTVPGLPVFWAVPGTQVRIMTNRAEPALRDIGVIP